MNGMARDGGPSPWSEVSGTTDAILDFLMMSHFFLADGKLSLWPKGIWGVG